MEVLYFVNGWDIKPAAIFRPFPNQFAITSTTTLMTGVWAIAIGLDFDVVGLKMGAE